MNAPASPDTETLLPVLAEAKERFLGLVAAFRPELHRYSSRMTGSVFDGEDVLQESLAKAYFAMAQMTEIPPLKPWLLRIVHNTSIDFLRRYDRKHVDLVAEVPESAPYEDREVDPDRVEMALARFTQLSPTQRSAVILKDVLGHSLEEVAETMGTSIGAVKGALTRGRANLAVVDAQETRAMAVVGSEEHANLRRYAALFNTQDWDGLRALLAEDARLDLVSRLQRGVAEARYYHRYAEIVAQGAIRAEPVLVEGVPALAMFRPPASAAPTYFLLLAWHEGRVTRIRDFYYVPYVAQSARFTML